MQFTVFASFPAESWRVSPRPGPFARDRAPLSPRRPQQGQAPARCVMRRPGVELRSSGSHVDAGRNTMLALVVGIANIVQEVKTGNHTATQDLNPSVRLTLRAHRTQRSLLTLRLERASSPAASSRLRRSCCASGNRAAGPTRSGSSTTAADRTLSLATQFPPARWLTA
jgi:hypothetical protein